jgi:exonuclease III
MNLPILNFATLNTRGIRNKSKRIALFEWIEEKRINIMFLQETYCTEEFIHEFNTNCKVTVIHGCSNTVHAKGECVIFSQNLNIEILSTSSKNDGGTLLINAKIQDQNFTLVNVYGPTSLSEGVDYLRSINEWVRENALLGSRLIIGGDFNTVLSKQDQLSGIIDKSTKTLNDLICSLDRKDI